MTIEASCHVCGENNPTILEGFGLFTRVTSDIKPWGAGGELRHCGHCGAVQTTLDERWHDDVAAIYRNYSIYDTAAGAEQKVFDQKCGAAVARSEQMLSLVRGFLPKKESGRYFDFGCGNGATLRAFSGLFPEWRATGYEVHDRFRSVVESIPGVERFVCGELSDVSGTFDIISLVHVLEHIAEPARLLSTIRERLADDGVLLVQVPDCEANPFMYCVVDHATHFSLAVLKNLVTRCGFGIRYAMSGVFGKELTIVASRSTEQQYGDRSDTLKISAVNEQLSWLAGSVAFAKTLAMAGGAGHRFGLFGTSVAATWMFGEIQGAVSFFVDEDVGKIGKMHLDRDIISPSEVPRDGVVHLCQPPVIAKKIAERLKKIVPVHWHW
jgi:SAM-dependent methyltransferase